MSTLKVSKVLSALPGTLVADMIYLVRVGTGFDMYVTDSTGALAYKSNAPSSNTSVTALVSASGVVNINCALGDMFTLALTANTTVTFSNLPAAGYGTTKSVLIQQPATGGPYTLTMPASFKPVTGTDTAIQTGASARTDLMIKSYDQGTRWAYVMRAVAA